MGRLILQVWARDVSVQYEPDPYGGQALVLRDGDKYFTILGTPTQIDELKNRIVKAVSGS